MKKSIRPVESCTVHTCAYKNVVPRNRCLLQTIFSQILINFYLFVFGF